MKFKFRYVGETPLRGLSGAPKVLRRGDVIVLDYDARELSRNTSEALELIERFDGDGETQTQENPQIAALKAELGSLRTERDGLVAELETADGERDQLQAELNKLKADRDQLQAELTKLQAKLTKLQAKAAPTPAQPDQPPAATET